MVLDDNDDIFYPSGLTTKTEIQVVTFVILFTILYLDKIYLYTYVLIFQNSTDFTMFLFTFLRVV